MARIPRNIKILGWVSFLTDVSSEMILPILPLFLKNVLKASMTSIGVIEGVAEATASLLKVVSGYWSDKAGKRKPFILAGYSLSAFAKPVLALTTAWWQVLAIRFTDRVGKGLRTPPRDALIADTSAVAQRGKSFGFHRAMDTLGAALGTLIAFLLLTWKVEAYRLVFVLSIIPGLLAVCVLVFLLKETPIAKQKITPDTSPEHDSGPLPLRLLLLMGIMVVFTFANVSYAFFILKINAIGISAALVPLVYLFYNLVYAALAMPVGMLSDKIGRERILLSGFFIMVFLLWGFSRALLSWQAWVLFFFYGITSAIVETIPRAWISDWARQAHRGSALGLYHTLVGLAALPASIVFGAIWHSYGSSVAFTYAMVISIASFVLLAIFRRVYS
ncbi:MAG: MFS transporter [Calditrichaeota bacterium]|nr:MFS transporter [Calditrichota bacterium]